MIKKITNYTLLLAVGLLLGKFLSSFAPVDDRFKIKTGNYQTYIADPKYRIKLYGTDDCGYCKKLKHIFDNNEIEYIYANVLEDKTFKKQFDELGEGSTPLVIIGESLIQGFHKELIISELTKLGYKISP